MLPDRRACVWFRLLYALLVAWAIMVASQYVQQLRFQVFGLHSKGILTMYDSLRGEFYLTPLPRLADPDNMPDVEPGQPPARQGV